MSLVAAYTSTDESSCSESLEEESNDEHLPLPSFSKSKGASTLQELRERKSTEHSVYSNPFIRQKEQSLMAISKHAPLTTAPEETAEDRKLKKRRKKQINKPCILFFKKGICKYEDKCKFMHHLPSDNATMESSHNIVNSNTVISCIPNTVNFSPSFVSHTNVSESLKKKNKNITNVCFMDSQSNTHKETNKTDLFWENGHIAGKKRPGLSDNIIPSKKSLKMYRKHSKT